MIDQMRIIAGGLIGKHLKYEDLVSGEFGRLI